MLQTLNYYNFFLYGPVLLNFYTILSLLLISDENKKMCKNPQILVIPTFGK